jgi:ribosome-associated protein
MRSVAEKIRDHLNETYGTQIAKSVAQNSDWVCVDAADIIVHVFTPSSRQFYDIETLYKDAVDVELPFETERPISQEEEDEFEVF